MSVFQGDGVSDAALGANLAAGGAYIDDLLAATSSCRRASVKSRSPKGVGTRTVPGDTLRKTEAKTYYGPGRAVFDNSSSIANATKK